MHQNSTWFVYFVRTAAGSLYAGITTDVERRFKEHCSGGRLAAKYLKGKGPLSLVYFSEAGDRVLASRLEYRMKRLTKQDKELLISGKLSLESLTAELS